MLMHLVPSRDSDAMIAAGMTSLIMMYVYSLIELGMVHEPKVVVLQLFPMIFGHHRSLELR